jgi:hypothetical protein
MHRTLIRQLKQLAERYHWLSESQPMPTEEAVELALKPPAEETESNHILDSYHDDLKRWLDDNISYVVMHQLLEKEVPISESTVRRYCQKHYPAAPKTSYVRTTIPGEIMEVDFGHLGIVYDPKTKKNRKAQVFSGRLRHSGVAWREIVFDQKQETFFQCHVHAFEFFGGVPQRVVPDNLKAAVVKASHTDPVINRVYQSLAEHYNFIIEPCLPYTPQHKGGVEGDIKFIKRNFWPLHREAQRRLGQETPSTEGIQKALDGWGKEVSQRVKKGAGTRPIDLFEQEEAASLHSLPETRWATVTWASAKVQETWSVQVDRAYYSVPFQYIGKNVLVFTSGSQVDIYDNYTLIASHTKAEKPWQKVRDPAHNPPNVEAFLSGTREGLQQWAAKIGIWTEMVVCSLLDRKVADGLRPARAVLNLSKTYGQVRLEAACERAVLFDNMEYGTINRILKQELDRQKEAVAVDADCNYCFTFARQAGYFDRQPAHAEATL